MTDVLVSSIRTELRTDTTDVATPTPRLTWKTSTAQPNWRQASAEIELDGGEVAAIAGDASSLVDWPFAPIAPRSRHSLRVRVTGDDGAQSGWSEAHDFVAAFLADGEWAAPMIGLTDPDHIAQPVLLRTEIEVGEGLTRATLYATAHGAYQVSINGAEVDDQILKPGWTSYQYRLVHETTDVTALLKAGANAIGVNLAGAWYTENFGFREGAARFYGNNPAAAVQLVLDYADGRSETVLSGSDWRATGTGPITASGIYAGEAYDATREIEGWASAGFDDSGWTAARVDSDEYPTPHARETPAVRAIEELPVREVLTSPSGATILDFGQNLVGRLRVTVRGERGTTITLRHAEVLENGELGIRPLRNAKATDHYTLSGSGEETWEPQFTFHGFRYASIDNWPGSFDPADVTAVVIHSDMKRTGWFESSHPLVNQLHENVVWGMRGNFLYVPTDCPQRDERLGWTGDIQVFSPTASFLFETDAFLSGWLKDLASEQAPLGGIVPFVVPNVLGDARTPAAAWGDAATVVPSVLHERFGNLEVVAEQYGSMRAWADTLLGLSGTRMLWEDGFQFGDWLDPAAPPEFPADAKTDPDIVASAYLYRSVDFVERAATLLAKTEDATKYGELREHIRRAFVNEYVSEGGRMISDAQTGYATAIMFGLYRDEAGKQAMGDRLAVLVRAGGYRIGTGFVGTPLIADALTLTGHLDEATRLLTQTENPSWLYPVTMGATTIWERWDSMLEDGSINPGEMTSFNHYALGAVADWLQRSVAGLGTATPGYKVIEIAPHFLAGFDHASAKHETPYGLASVAWKRDGATVTVTATVPPNSSARVILPGGDAVVEVGSGDHEWTVQADAGASAHADVSDETSLADLVDDREAYETVIAAIAATTQEGADIFRRHTKWTAGVHLGGSFHQLPPKVHADVTASLALLNASRNAGR